MRRAQIARFRSALEEQLVGLVGHGETTVHAMIQGGEELPDPNDRATRESDRAQELRLRDRDRRLIAKIREALDRIDHGTFGRCEACGREISAARLRARPVTTFCIDCKQESEAHERR